MSLHKIMQYSGNKYHNIPVEVLMEHHIQELLQTTKPNGTYKDYLNRRADFINEILAWQKLAEEQKKIEEENKKNLEQCISSSVNEILKDLIV